MFIALIRMEGNQTFSVIGFFPRSVYHFHSLLHTISSLNLFISVKILQPTVEFVFKSLFSSYLTTKAMLLHNFLLEAFCFLCNLHFLVLLEQPLIDFVEIKSEFSDL